MLIIEVKSYEMFKERGESRETMQVSEQVRNVIMFKWNSCVKSMGPLYS